MPLKFYVHIILPNTGKTYTFPDTGYVKETYRKFQMYFIINCMVFRASHVPSNNKGTTQDTFPLSDRSCDMQV